MNHDVDEARRRLLHALAGSVAIALLDPQLALAAHSARARLQQSDARYLRIDRLADLVIPTTDTPGASVAGAAAFVLLALDQRISDLVPAMYERVHAALDATAGGAYFRLPPTQQSAVLAQFDRAAHADAAPAGGAHHAWRRIKAAIIVGYYTSEIGASHELVYDPVPGGTSAALVTPEFRSSVYDGMGEALGG